MGFDGNDTLNGALGEDRIYGGNGADTINAGTGADWIDGGAGADIIDGGAGQDVLHFAKTGAGVTVDFQPPSGVGIGAGGDAAGDTYDNIEVVIGTDQNDTFKAWNGSGKSFAGGEGEDRFEVLLDGINNKVNACVAAQPEVILFVKKVLIGATIAIRSPFFAQHKTQEKAG
ncbi:MAG: hypothetical protein L3J37_11580 [Rhodobacteraceae bacterium]|nr:hypothetical protein [Paracoccaceae bacterium]